MQKNKDNTAMAMEKFQDLIKRGYKLVNFIEEQTGVRIKVVFAGPNDENDGRCICKNELIIIYQNRNNWSWLREVLVHESAHRLDHEKRGNMHHNPKYEHDLFFYECYHEILRVAKKSPYW